jgi:hypothetical protein
VGANNGTHRIATAAIIDYHLDLLKTISGEVINNHPLMA